MSNPHHSESGSSYTGVQKVHRITPSKLKRVLGGVTMRLMNVVGSCALNLHSSVRIAELN
jgi:acyl-coenzyme A thioesterase PaaI-like protein